MKFNASRFKPLLLTALVLVLSVSGFSQILEPVKWSFSKEKLKDNTYELQLKATIDEHWHLYSQDIPEGGPRPTTFNFETEKGYELIGKTKEPKAIEEMDPNFDMVVKYFAEEATFTQKVKITTDEPVVIKGYVNFMCCDDTRCLPPSDKDFTFTFNGADASQATASAEESQAPVMDVKTIEESDETVSAQKDQEKAKGEETIDTQPKNTGGGGLTGQAKKSLWLFFGFSFLAGLAAILTPCVFPMIPMTVTFFMHDKKSKGGGKASALIYGFSIIAIYTIVGTVVAVTLGANFANFLSTHWLPNIFFFLIFTFFAASFLGMFELTLPSWMINKADQKADKGGFVGAFFMAFTLVLVSFSCTGPIVGAILVASAGGEVLTPIIGMLGFSLAFALPFTLFAFFPSWLANMPKSGGWLNSVKVVLGFLELALGLKFLSIADQTYHWGLLDREIYLALWIVIFTLLGFYLLGKLKFANDSDTKFVSVPRTLLAIVTFSFVVYMIPGMFGAPLKGLSGYLPPQQTHDFDLHEVVRENAKLAVTAAGGSGTLASGNTDKTLCQDPKYSDFLHLPHGLEGYFDYEQALNCARKVDKPIFIDFTGHGCVNCREMEANVWSDPRVLQRLRDDFVIAALYVDDKTKLPESEWVKSSYDGKWKKTLGKKYADFQISRFNVNAQPYYVLLDTNGEILVEPRAYSLKVDAFVEFLDKGLKEFKERKNEGKLTMAE
ncbi:MAG: thioredoxin family protein [Bacteroidales bacterium]|nr:thioredoxin family protein [Bacteroidales bacterium]